MIRRLSLFSLVIVAMVWGASIVCLAQPQYLLTSHVRDMTLNGQAPFVGQLPATQSMRIDIVLPVRDQPRLDGFLQEVYDPSSPVYRHFLTVLHSYRSKYYRPYQVVAYVLNWLRNW